MTDQNFRPTLSPPAQFIIYENASLNAVVGNLNFFDLDNGTQTYTFLLSRPDVFAIAYNPVTLTASLTLIAALDYTVQSQYLLSMNVTDSYVLGPLSSATLVTVSLLLVNRPPVVPNTTQQASTFTLPGAAIGSPIVCSDHNASAVLTFALVGASNTTLFSVVSVTGLSMVAQVVVNPALSGPLRQWTSTPTFLLTLRATDAFGLSSTATVNVTLVTTNYPPVVTPVNFSLPESATSATGTWLVSYSDVDANQTHACAISGGNTLGHFAVANLGNASCQITVANAGFSYVAAPYYLLTVSVQDFPANPTDTLTGSASVYVFVTHVNHAPTVTPSTVFTVNELQPVGNVVGQVIAGDVDIACCGDNLTYSIVTAGVPFAVNNRSGNVTFARVLSVIVQPYFTFTVQVTDGAGMYAQGVVTVTLMPVPVPPTLAATTFSVVEHAAAGTVIGSLAPYVYDQNSSQTFHYALLSGAPDGLINVTSMGQVCLAGIGLSPLCSLCLSVSLSVSLCLCVSLDRCPPLFIFVC